MSKGKNHPLADLKIINRSGRANPIEGRNCEIHMNGERLPGVVGINFGLSGNGLSIVKITFEAGTIEIKNVGPNAGVMPHQCKFLKGLQVPVGSSTCNNPEVPYEYKQAHRTPDFCAHGCEWFHGRNSR